MKTTSKLLATFFVFVLLITACSEDEALTPNPVFNPEATGENPMLPTGNGNGGQTLNPPYVIADIDGSTINFGTTIWDTEIDSASGANNEGIYAYTADVKELYFAIERPVVSDTTYELDLLTATGAYRSDTANTDSSNTFLLLEGHITVNEFDSANQVYKGSFKFKGYNINGTDSVEIENGIFEFN